MYSENLFLVRLIRLWPRSWLCDVIVTWSDLRLTYNFTHLCARYSFEGMPSFTFLHQCVREIKLETQRRGSKSPPPPSASWVKQVLPIHVRTKKCSGAATSLFQLRQLARRSVQRWPGSIVTLADPPVPDGPNQGLSNCMGRRARRPVAMCDTFATDCTYIHTYIHAMYDMREDEYIFPKQHCTLVHTHEGNIQRCTKSVASLW